MNVDMIPSACAIALFVACVCDGTSGQDDRPRTAVPSRSTDEMLQRFVDECVRITPGEGGFPTRFVIGAESPMDHELPRKDAGIVYHFRISRYETTQELYQTVMGTNPSRWKGPRNSVENVRWSDASAFCRKLTELLQTRKLIDANEIVRLPDAVEWEYCCRAGSTTRFCFGDNAGGDSGGTATLDEYAWHTGNAAGNDPAVGVLKANAWGLHDFHGYLWEFVSDQVSRVAAEGDVSDGKSGEQRTIRGGSWRDPYSLLSSSAYLTVPADALSDAIGFRCVIAQKPVPKKTPNQ